MCQFDYTKSYKKISNGDRIAIRKSRVGKSAANCTLVPKPNKTLIIATPFMMAITEAGERIERISRFYKGYNIIPISMPRGAV